VGGLKTRTVKDQLERAPEEVLRKAVQRMLPDNKLRVARMRKLRLVVGSEHGFAAEALTPFEMPPRNDSRPTPMPLEAGLVPLNPADWSSYTLPDGRKFGDLTLVLQGSALPVPTEKELEEKKE